MNDPNLIPQSAILAGTLHQVDRSRQYQEADPKQLLRSQNDAWTQIRQLQKSNGEKDSKILELERNIRWERTWRWGIVAGVIVTILASIIIHLT